MNRSWSFYLVGVLLLWSFFSCKSDNTIPPQPETPAGPILFTSLPATATGLDFVNDVREDVTSEFNVLSYEYYFNGGGVGVGDLNNDGMQDVVLTGNTSPNKLFLNKGNMQFADVTEQAAINQGKQWSNGVTLADVNGDGWLDIYISQGGPQADPKVRKNLLFINNGLAEGSTVPTFTEKAEEYGLADTNRSNQAAFFDYDKDGDLDCFVINNANYFRVVLPAIFDDLKIKKNLEEASSNLFRNDNGKFVKVTEPAGMLRYGYGLGLAISDINEDGWLDVYVSNDYSVPDFMYINNGDGTFTDQIKEKTSQISFFGMGCDIADFNNDGLVDIAQVDMAADDHIRDKTLMESMNVQGFSYFVHTLGYQYAYMFNSFQLNNGNGTFSNIAGMAGVLRTDWSWAALLADFDNDGWKDYFVSNGYRRYARDNDFRNEMARRRDANGGSIPLKMRQEMYDMMPQVMLPNIAYRNNKDLTFSNATSDWGLNQPSYSNGTAYADLDNDGDLDLVINNIHQPVFLYRNNAVEQGRGNFLRIQLQAETPSTPKAGTRVALRYGDEMQFQEWQTSRGFQSTVDETLHFGLGEVEKVDRIEVVWPNGKSQVIANVHANQTLVINQKEATEGAVATKVLPTPAVESINPYSLGIDFRHQENAFDDFIREGLLPHRQSTLGPGIAVADVNGDQLDDFFVGGAAGQAGVLYIQNPDGTFHKGQFQPWADLDIASEDMDALFFDADHNGTMDLYVVSGGSGEFQPGAGPLQDRLYINYGGERFQKVNALPPMKTSGKVVKAADFDGDGDFDLFVGGAAVPGKYPFPERSYLLRCDQNKYTDVTAEVAPGLMNPGMVKDALWTDLNKDARPDLVIVGEWMPVMVFLNENAQFRDASEEMGTADLRGWWQSIAEADIDADGDMDLLVGNVGLNSKFHVSPEKPLKVFGADFDNNGISDVVLSKPYKDQFVPARGRQCSSEQMPFIKEKFPTYNAYAHATLEEVYGKDKLKDALELTATTFASMILTRGGDGKFEAHELPNLAQVSPINAIIPGDYNGDGHTDLLIAGNNFDTEVETPRYDAGTGLFLRGDGKGNFVPVRVYESGFYASGNAKDMVLIRLAGNKGQLILVANNDAPLQAFRIKPGENPI
ncbi:MAG: VCBS repeat-containing protein [Saprospirales bacterium]|nr:VCBS repeat-containing protein [Saprospirales bacterium]